MTIQELFTTYWSQVTLLLIAISYFIKRLFDDRSKRREINHSLFQEKRLESIQKFMKIYAETDNMWNMLSIYEVMRHELSAKELDAIIFPHLNELKCELLQVKMYLDEKHHQPFDDIVSNTNKINQSISDGYNSFDPAKKITTMVNHFHEACSVARADNENVFKRINKIVKENFS